MINVALLGSGLFASGAYLPSLVANKSTTTLHTIWSRSQKSSDGLVAEAKKLGLLPAGQYGDEGMEAVLSNPDIDAVCLVLPITVQPELVLKALKAGKHVLSEKPLAKDVKGARELIAEYERVYKPKGLIWRVAENWAHEPIYRYARELLNTEGLGPMLYYQCRSEGVVLDGSSWHSTTWRTVPDYQGGFILDGGVHMAAMLRVVLPTPIHTVLSRATLHRTHLVPHDTVIAITSSAPSSTVDSFGPPTNTKTAQSIDVIPTAIGQSNVQGTILLTFATPNIPVAKRQESQLQVTCLNGTLTITQLPGQMTKVTLTGAEGSGVKDTEKESKGCGVEVEIKMFANAVAETKAGKEPSEENYGEPRDTMWDLALIEACLSSEGKEVVLDQLMQGQQ